RDAEEFTYSMNLEPGENNFEISAIGEGVKPLVSIGLLIIYEDERKKVFYTIKAKETVLIKL
ncbi:MAG: hypothetical protein H7Y07_05010, partial [Pyrinomonadaceae bacterium]|nr:hypothetical protein [Sphingobacteriaceae bacterium]